VLDANTVVSAVLKRNSVPERALFQALEKDVLCLSDAVFREYEEVLQRPKLAALVPPGRSDDLLGRILAVGRFVDPATPVAECRDPGDDKYLELALAAGADLIVSGDRDLLELDPWRGVRIVPAAVYLGRGWPNSARNP
jgi:hypothetical protein